MTPQPPKEPKLFKDYVDEASKMLEKSISPARRGGKESVLRLATFNFLDDLAREVHGLRGEVERLKGTIKPVERDETKSTSAIKERICPTCGNNHDWDYCPYCNLDSLP